MMIRSSTISIWLGRRSLTKPVWKYREKKQNRCQIVWKCYNLVLILHIITPSRITLLPLKSCWSLIHALLCVSIGLIRKMYPMDCWITHVNYFTWVIHGQSAKACSNYFAWVVKVENVCIFFLSKNLFI